MKGTFTKYLVTYELHTSIVTRVLRFLKLKKQREEFVLNFWFSGYKKNDILYNGKIGKLLIIKRL